MSAATENQTHTPPEIPSPSTPQPEIEQIPGDNPEVPSPSPDPEIPSPSQAPEIMPDTGSPEITPPM